MTEPTPAQTPATEPAPPPSDVTDHAVPAAEAVPARHRLRPATAAGRLVTVGGRTAWTAARRPYGRLALGGFLILALVGTTVVLGAILVPRTAKPRPVAAASTEPTATGGATGPLPTGTASFSPSPTTSPLAANEGLTEWATRLAPKVEIPPVALRAYGYAEWVLSQRKPGCKLTWTTLAAIGWVESNHGRSGASTLAADGRALPPIIGPALDGKDGRKKIVDSDAGALDNDRAFDHAVGPMQFIPATWRSYAIDADGDGITDPSDIDDAALAAAYQLCAANKDLTVAANWAAAIRGYNNVVKYLQDVFTAANAYGQKSRT